MKTRNEAAQIAYRQAQERRWEIIETWENGATLATPDGRKAQFVFGEEDDCDNGVWMFTRLTEATGVDVTELYQ
jgi:hypothetical protein